VSLRARLLAVVASLVLAGLAVAAVATYYSLQRFLTDRVDTTLATSAAAIAQTPRAGLGPGDGGRSPPNGPGGPQSGPFQADDLLRLGGANPGLYVGQIATPGGAVAWSAFAVRTGEQEPSPPRLPALGASAVAAFSASAVEGSRRYRVRTEPLGGGATLVVALPLDDVAATLRRLVVVEAGVGAAVLAAALLGGLALVWAGLAPLRRIEGTAAAIAA